MIAADEVVVFAIAAPDPAMAATATAGDELKTRAGRGAGRVEAKTEQSTKSPITSAAMLRPVSSGRGAAESELELGIST